MNVHKPIILILTDGRPGHETQSIGIAKILNDDQSYEIQFLKIQQPSKFFKQVCKKAYSWLPKFWMLKHFISTEQVQHLSTEQNVQYIVSAGGDTLLPNALLKFELTHQNRLVKNIIATSLRGMPPSAYDLVFTIDEAKQYCPPYVYYPVAPNKLISFNLKQDIAQARNSLKINVNSSHCWSVLIGADTVDVKIGVAEHWITMIQDIHGQAPNDQIFITTSRRTSPAFEAKLKALADQPNTHLILVGEGNQTPIQDLIYAADYILCSPDSTSMVSECVMAEKKLIVPRFSDTNLSQQFVDYYEKIKEFVDLTESSRIYEVFLKNSASIDHKQHLKQIFLQALDR